ncbi:MAG: transglycosylase domain-containing protein, partial [Bdellovibrionales bacterium]|nr:transglycosylase domain-containing protein [Bdellovibrionales bacterium]
IMSLQIEQIRSKEEILEMYLTVVPEGSNVYSITSGADFYFDKEVDELTLAELTVLASLPQNPSLLSPTKSIDPERGARLLQERRDYVFAQLERNLDYINRKSEELGNPVNLTQEMIDEARGEVLSYQNPDFDILAPHFVTYAEKLLQERGYNNGEPFDITELQTGGYKIYTTLDMTAQQIAEEQVKLGVDQYGRRYGGYNAALVALEPKTGEIIAMAGSYDYFGEPFPENCISGLTCKYEPSVNVLDTLQSYGSTMKSHVYYMAIMDGLISPGSQLLDIPIRLGSYAPKNYEGGFVGASSARRMLSSSRNIPAIYLIDQIGVDRFVAEMKKWGYTTFTNPNGYGPAISIGGADVKLIEHAQGYSVFANGGTVTQHEVIAKIVDRDGNVIYEHKPELERVADERGIFLINDILNGNRGGPPGRSFDGRDLAGKTGTSEDQKENLFATYTPELVVVGWIGNNNNDP